MSRLTLVPLLLVAACSSESARETGPSRALSQSIVNGTPSTAADNAVVFISINGSSESFCTGTLIAPNLVLTARHCVAKVGDGFGDCGGFTTQMAPSSLTIRLGVQPGTTTVATAKKIIVDAGKPASMCSNDIALFQLDRDVPGAMIAKVRLAKLTVGEAARAAGYGDDGAGTPTKGRYSRSGIKVDSIGPSTYKFTTKDGQVIDVPLPAGEIVTGESTCFGDSGGPLFDAKGNVIGVTSRGLDEKCIDRPSIFSDVASHAKVITDAAAAAGHPLTDGPGPGTDPDATEEPDPTKDEAAEKEEDEEEEETPAPKKKKRASNLGQQPSSGCSTAPGHAPASSLLVVGLALGAFALRRRRSQS